LYTLHFVFRKTDKWSGSEKTSPSISPSSTDVIVDYFLPRTARTARTARKARLHIPFPARCARPELHSGPPLFLVYSSVEAAFFRALLLSQQCHPAGSLLVFQHNIQRFMIHTSNQSYRRDPPCRTTKRKPNRFLPGSFHRIPDRQKRTNTGRERC